MDKAAEATGTESPSLESIKTTATEGMGTAATQRTTLATSVDEAWHTFTTTATENAATINGFQSLMKTAQYISEVPVADIIQACQNGTLSADEMWYIDQISSKEDAQALKAIISDDPGKVTDVDPNKISESMYNVVASETTDMVEEKNAGRLEKLVNGIGKTDEGWAKVFTEQMLYAGDRLASGQILIMGAQYETASPDDLSKMQAHLNAINQMNGLFETIYINEAWHVDDVEDTEYLDDEQWHEFKISFSDTGGINIKDTTMRHNDIPNLPRDKELGDYQWEVHEYTSDITSSSDSQESKELRKEYYDIEQKRSKAQADYVNKTLKLAADTTLMAATLTVAPEFVPFMSAVLSGNPESFEGMLPNEVQLLLNQSEFSEYYKDYTKQMSQYNKKDLELRDEYSSKLFDEGGWYLKQTSSTNEYGDKDKTKKVVATSREHFNDFGAVMREKYLDEHGVTEYLDDKQLAQYKTILNDNDIDNNVVDYLTNPNSQITYEKLDWQEVDDALDYLKNSELGSGADESGFRKDLSGRYVIEAEAKEEVIQ